MKLYISADIEGCTGMAAPEEANPDRADIKYFQQQMTDEVRAACEGAIAAGATDILVKDAHWNGQNIDPRQLPRLARIVRGWTGHPFSMMAELDRSFDAVCFIGYHDRAGSGGNPLAHTFSGRVVSLMRVNGVPVSEFHINSYIASFFDVPVAFLSGDRSLCDDAKRFNDSLETYATMTGIGAATVSVHPHLAVDGIKDAVRRSLSRDLKSLPKNKPSTFQIEIEYHQPQAAFRASFYPGASLKDDRTVTFKGGSILDACTMIQFCIR